VTGRSAANELALGKAIATLDPALGCCKKSRITAASTLQHAHENRLSQNLGEKQRLVGSRRNAVCIQYLIAATRLRKNRVEAFPTTEMVALHCAPENATAAGLWTVA
jgi:hypothetical protein